MREREETLSVLAELEKTVPDVFRVLRETITDEEIKPELRIKCCEIVLDRVYGKTRQTDEEGGAGPVILAGVDEIAD